MSVNFLIPQFGGVGRMHSDVGNVGRSRSISGSKRSVAKLLAELTSVTLLSHDGDLLLVDPSASFVFTSGCSLTDLSRSLLEKPTRLEKAISLEGVEIGKHVFSGQLALDQLIWSLAMLEPVGDGPADEEPRERFSIAAWPKLGKWGADHQIANMASCFSRSFCTVEEVSERVGVKVSEVRRFLSACALVGIGVLTDADGVNQSGSLFASA